MSEEKGLKEKVTKAKALINKIKQFIDDIYRGEKTYDKIAGKFISASKIFIVSTRKFIADSCPTKASSIAYTAIISLIPTLTVILTFYSIFSGVGDKKDEIFNTITKFCQCFTLIYIHNKILIIAFYKDKHISEPEQQEF